MARSFKEVAHLRTNMENYSSGYDRIFKKDVKMQTSEQEKCVEIEKHEDDEILARLREAEKVIAFYGKEGNWDDRIMLILDDAEDTAWSSYNGGKLARKYQAKYGIK